MGFMKDFSLFYYFFEKVKKSGKIGVKVPATALVSYVGQLINDYKVDNLGQLRFKDYLAVLHSDSAVEDSE